MSAGGDKAGTGAKMWGGRFTERLDPFFDRFNQSLGFDVRLAPHDIATNRAWAGALGKAGVLGTADVQVIQESLDCVHGEWTRQGTQAFADHTTAEDIHTLMERLLEERVGDLARKLHTGRSRNDQVATDLKLYLRDAGNSIRRQITALMRTLVATATENAAVPMPGYTHLQRAQPITVGHHALAYVEMFSRDRARVESALQRMDTCPLGSGALAGTAFDIDRNAIAKDLDFRGGATRNSLDAVSDRDHACEIVFALSLVMVHLSRLAEDYIFFASHEAGFVTFGDAVATGSSLMPQKRNPDAMELIRGKCGRVLGALQGLLVTLKGLPLAYNKDMQEDKEGLFDALDTTWACLKIAATAVQAAEFHPEHCRDQCASGHLCATDLADLLVQQGVPFKDAHERVGRCVNRAVELGCELQDLPAEARAELLPEIADSLEDLLSVDAVLARRSAIGGTAPARVRAEVEYWQKELSG
ncbi:MAG: argininosuccinate lyase [Planctomycetota bacterium]|jgi:argininosuccinate lyase/amino-acid N-acetyltransferase